MRASSSLLPISLPMKSEAPSARALLIGLLVVAGDHQHRYLTQAGQPRRAHPGQQTVAVKHRQRQRSRSPGWIEWSRPAPASRFAVASSRKLYWSRMSLMSWVRTPFAIHRQSGCAAVDWGRPSRLAINQPRRVQAPAISTTTRPCARPLRKSSKTPGSSSKRCSASSTADAAGRRSPARRCQTPLRYGSPM
jgi:hypothetical protein